MKVRAVPEVLSLSGLTRQSQPFGSLCPPFATAHRPHSHPFAPVGKGLPALPQNILKKPVFASKTRQSTNKKIPLHKQIPLKLHRKLPLYAKFYVIFKDFPAPKIKIPSKALPKTTFPDQNSPFLLYKILFS